MADQTNKPEGKQPVPPAAESPSRQGPPLPVGKPMYFTGEEKRQLEALDIKDADKLPPNMAEIMEAAKRDAREDLPPPVDPSTPPVKFETLSIDDMSPEQQDKYREILRRAVKMENAKQESVQDPQPVPQGMDPSVAQAKRVADSPVPDFEIDVDLPKEKSPEPENKDSGTQTGSDPAMERCPHCEWPLILDDDTKVGDFDKQLFIQAQLGQVPFQKSYEFFAGNGSVTFRTLTIGELDLIYQTARDKALSKELITEQDYMEEINRMRLSLQLNKIELGDTVHELPDGLNKKTTPTASKVWSEDPDADDQLNLAENFINTEICRTESLQRIFRQLCGQFNRLISKMEAMVDSPDFWSPTGDHS